MFREELQIHPRAFRDKFATDNFFFIDRQEIFRDKLERNPRAAAVLQIDKFS